MMLKERVLAHWKRMHDDAPGCYAKMEMPNTLSCAFCYAYKHSGEIQCDGCPIKEKTGKKLCYDSPYWEAHEEWARYCESDWDEALELGWQAFASKMIRFLEELPDGE